MKKKKSILVHMLKVADKLKKKGHKNVKIKCPPGKYDDNITLKDGVSLSAI